MISSRGYVLGNLCVVGLEQRPFSEADVEILRDLAAEAVRRIEQRRVPE
jgi:GAF domain-containing protein